MSDNDEVSIIAHLLKVEKEASKIIACANIKADKEISDAKIAADAEFKKIMQNVQKFLKRILKKKNQKYLMNMIKSFTLIKLLLQECRRTRKHLLH